MLGDLGSKKDKLSLNMDENKKIALGAFEAHQKLELLIIYEGSYTESEYRVKSHPALK